MEIKFPHISELGGRHPLEWVLAEFLVPIRSSWDISQLLLDGETARKRMNRRRVVPHDFSQGSSMLLHTRLCGLDRISPLMAGLLELCIMDGFTKGFSPKPCIFTYTDRHGIKREVVPDAMLHFHGWITFPQASRPLLVTLRSQTCSAGDFAEQDAAVTAEAWRHGLSHVVLTETEVFSDYFRNLRLLCRVAPPPSPDGPRDPLFAQTIRRRGPMRVGRLIHFLAVDRAKIHSMPLNQARAEVLAALCRRIRWLEVSADLRKLLDFETVISAYAVSRAKFWSPFSEWTKRVPVTI